VLGLSFIREQRNKQEENRCGAQKTTAPGFYPHPNHKREGISCFDPPPLIDLA